MVKYSRWKPTELSRPISVFTEVWFVGLMVLGIVFLLLFIILGDNCFIVYCRFYLSGVFCSIPFHFASRLEGGFATGGGAKLFQLINSESFIHSKNAGWLIRSSILINENVLHWSIYSWLKLDQMLMPIWLKVCRDSVSALQVSLGRWGDVKTVPRR